MLTGAGEAIRLWAVNHIGAISRTRSERLGPLIHTGPFALVRNPLYIGNILVWVGFAVTARLLWLAPIILILLALEYHAIVKWEEALLESRHGQPYRDYLTRVPRWAPSFQRLFITKPQRTLRDLPGLRGFVMSCRATLFSERGTLLAIAAGYFLLWLKARF